MVIRPFQMSYVDELVFDPWLEDIFTNWKIFEKRLESIKFENVNMTTLKKIILNYLPLYFNNKNKPFIITEKEDKKFVDDLISKNLRAESNK